MTGTGNLPRFSEDVQAVLLNAGWTPGRCVIAEMETWTQRLTSKGLELFPAASNMLLEFGGLSIVQHGFGEEFARESFNFDPLHGEYEADFFSSHSQLIGEKLFPIGECMGGVALLGISESGKIYAFAGVVYLVGDTIDDALEHLIRSFGISMYNHNS